LTSGFHSSQSVEAVDHFVNQVVRSMNWLSALLLLLQFSFCAMYSLPRKPAVHYIRCNIMVMPHTHSFSNLVLAVTEAKPDSYQYGAVNAPGWVLPLAAVLAIATAAAIPIFLKPGQEALEQQRNVEKDTNNKFGKGTGNRRK
jgi:hypothetical protein